MSKLEINAVRSTKLARDIFRYGISNIILRALQIVQGLLVANILGPTLFGLKSTINMVFEYGLRGHLGILNSFSKRRQMTEFEEHNDKNLFSNVSFTFILFLSLFFIVIGLIFFVVTNYDYIIKLSILFISFGIAAHMFYSYFIVILQAQHNFKSISTSNIMLGLFSLLLAVLFILLLGVPGFFLGVAISYTIVVVYSYYRAKIKINLFFDKSTFFFLFKEGLLLFIISLFYLVFFSMDRIFLASYYDITIVGYYAIGLFFSNLMYFFLSTLNYPLIPVVLQNFKDKIKISQLIIRYNRVTSTMLYFIVILVIFLSPHIILVLPEYADGISYINVLMFGIIFFPQLINYYFIGLNKEKTLIFLSLLFVILGIILNFVVILLDLSPIYIAIVTVITIFLYGNILNLIGYRDLLDSWKLAFKEVFNYLWPLGYALVGYGLLWMLAHFWLYDFMNYYVVKVIQALLFTIWYSPILWKIEKEHKIMKMIWNNLKGKFRKKEVVEEQQIE